MFRLEAQLNTDTFFPGDTLYCNVVCYLQQQPEKQPTDAAAINWLCVQVGGHCTVESSQKKLLHLDTVQTPSNAPTSNRTVPHPAPSDPNSDPSIIGASARTIFSTLPTILAQNITPNQHPKSCN